MFKTRILTGLLITLALLFAMVGTAAAAPSAQDTTPITGTVDSVTPETDETGVTTFLVTLTDDQGGTQTVRISLETALELGLVLTDPETSEPVLDPETGGPVVDDSMIGQTLELDPAVVIPDESEEEEAVHPIAALLAAFFGEEGSVVDEYHDDGFGFGVIAQAMWMSQHLNGDPTLTAEILEAKETGDYSSFVLPDGSTPANWGQFKKAVLEKKNNLGVVVSGQADPLTEDGQQTQFQNGNGNGQGNGQGNGNGNGQGNGNGNGQGNNKNKDKEKGKDK